MTKPRCCDKDIKSNFNFFSEGFQDSQGHLCLLNALLHHEVKYTKLILQHHKVTAALTLFNLSTLIRDPDHWEEPNKFKPERFLDEEGRLVRNERFLPFGVGT